jgi:hypothetical protein
MKKPSAFIRDNHLLVRNCPREILEALRSGHTVQLPAMRVRDAQPQMTGLVNAVEAMEPAEPIVIQRVGIASILCSNVPEAVFDSLQRGDGILLNATIADGALKPSATSAFPRFSMAYDSGMVQIDGLDEAFIEAAVAGQPCFVEP